MSFSPTTVFATALVTAASRPGLMTRAATLLAAGV